MSTGDVGCKDGEGDQNNSTEQPPAETMTESVKKNISEPENVGDSLSAPSETVTNPESSASADEVKTDIPVAQIEQTKTADTIDNVELIDMSEEMKKSAEAEDLGEGGGDAEENEDQFVVHVDESDTNLDYDLGDKPEERDAPTPTKDESMDVDAADIIQTGNGATPTEGTGEKTTPKADATSTDQAAKRFVVSNFCFLLKRKSLLKFGRATQGRLVRQCRSIVRKFAVSFIGETGFVLFC